jgi:hypothetical protein
VAANYVRASEIKDGAASLKPANSLAQVCAVIDDVREDFPIMVRYIRVVERAERERGTQRKKEKISNYLLGNSNLRRSI